MDKLIKQLVTLNEKDNAFTSLAKGGIYGLALCATAIGAVGSVGLGLRLLKINPNDSKEEEA